MCRDFYTIGTFQPLGTVSKKVVGSAFAAFRPERAIGNDIIQDGGAPFLRN